MSSEQPATIRFRNPQTRQPFTQSPNSVMYSTRISVSARLLYHLLLGHARQEDEAHPGQARLASYLKVSERQIRTLTRELEDVGLITVEQRGLGLTNRYWVEDLPEEFLTGNRLLTGPEVEFRSDRKWSSHKEDAVEEDTEQEERRRAAERRALEDVEAIAEETSSKRKRGKKVRKGIPPRGPSGSAPDPELDEEPPPEPKLRGRQREIADWTAWDLANYMRDELAEQGRENEFSQKPVAAAFAKWRKQYDYGPETIKAMIDLVLHEPPDQRNAPAWKVLVYRHFEVLKRVEANREVDYSQEYSDL